MRSILIFPQFDNMGVIDRIRRRYDPLAAAIRPHITLAFPFDSTMSDAELCRAVGRAVEGVQPIALEMRGFSRQSDDFGHYLFLNMVRGEESVRAIHDRLYSGALRQFDMGYPYKPHITVGKLPDARAMEAAYREISGITDEFCTMVRRISVERIGENDESIIICEKEL